MTPCEYHKIFNNAGNAGNFFPRGRQEWEFKWDFKPNIKLEFYITRHYQNCGEKWLKPMKANVFSNVSLFVICL